MALQLGYSLSSEEHGPHALVDQAKRAEDAGFGFALISDHFHPWTSRQGHSPFVWTVLGGIARETRTLRIGTGVTAPTIRIHPAIIAQAAATTAAMMPGRFFLGVGSGESLNEHILGDRWPPSAVRLKMLEEAIDVLRTLWRGGVQSHRGEYYTVENARIFDLPPDPVEIAVAASAKQAAELAGRCGDALVSVGPEREIVDEYAKAGGRGPRYGQMTVCWAATEEEARRTAHELWPISGMPGKLITELATPSLFEQVATMVSEDDVARSVVCGPDPERHAQAIVEFAEAGFDHVYVHQVGPDQEGFVRFYCDQVMPRVAGVEPRRAA